MIFDDSIADAQAKSAYQQRRGDLAQLVHDSNSLLITVFDALKKRPHTSPAIQNHVAALLLARHVMEMVDGVGVLVDKGCASPCKAVLRSVLEAALGVKYIAQADSDRRNIAYQVEHAHKRMKMYLKYDGSTQQGQAFSQEMKTDSLWQTMNPAPFDFKKAVQNLESLLKRPEFAPVEQEWQAIKNKNPKRKDDPHWYSLFNGPANVRELAKALDMRGEYEFLYRDWSETIHAGAAMSQVKGVTVSGTNQTIFLPLRNPKELQTFGSVAISLCLTVAQTLVEKYSPQEVGTFTTRYVHEIQPRFMSIQNAGPLINVPW